MNNQTYKAAQPAYDIISIKENVDALCECAWIIGSVSHWILYSNTDQQISKVKKCIKNILLSYKDPYKAYMDLCEAILEEGQHITGFKCTSVCGPLSWLTVYSKNLVILRVDIIMRRNCNTVSKQKLIRKAYAEAVLSMYEEPTPANFNYWISWFKERKAFEEYLSFVMATLFNILKIKSC